MNRKQDKRIFETYRAFAWTLLLLGVSLPRAFAVVGQAERYDPFEQERLELYQEKILAEEKAVTMQMLELKGDPASQTDDFNAELDALKESLLEMPKRDRIKMGVDGKYTFNSNVNRDVPGKQKSDSVFDLAGFVEFDLGGKKTDLRFELNGAKQWNIEFSNSDFWKVEERIRYRRKYFRKLNHSFQSAIARHSERTIEIDSKKVRYDSNQNTILNYAFSRKLSFNLDLNSQKRLFTTEAFDQDSNWGIAAAPSLFWNVTPKSRFGLGYVFGANRIRTKTGDTNSHEIKLNYFGSVTRKSSLSFDMSFSHQTPRSEDTASVNTYKIGAGYIWQMTPKTQMILQAIRSLQNSSSNSVAGEDENTTVKTDAYFLNDSINFSVNSRLNRKLTAVFTTGLSHFRNKVSKTGDEDTETRQWTFPTSVTLNYLIKRWLTLRLNYSFAYRTGNEKNDTYRNHILTSSVNMVF